LDPTPIATSTCISHSSQKSNQLSCDYCLVHGSGDMRRSHIPCFIPACAAAGSLGCGRKEDERRQKMNALGRKETSSLGYIINVTRVGRRNDESMRTKTAESDSFVRSFVRSSFVRWLQPLCSGNGGFVFTVVLEEETGKVAAAESSEKTAFPACGFVLRELLVPPTVCSFAGVSSGEVWSF
jgi:hypothetical protein